MSDSEYSDSDSDAGLPPPLPKKQLAFKMPGLAISGLGLSTVAKDGGKTAEEMSDMAALRDAMKGNDKKKDSSEDESSDGEISPINADDDRNSIDMAN